MRTRHGSYTSHVLNADPLYGPPFCAPWILIPTRLHNSYGVEDAEYAISQLAQTTMRSEIGQLTLDHVLKERAALNTNITAAINEASSVPWSTCSGNRRLGRLIG